MYFNHEKDDTNIDSEFEPDKRFNFNFDFNKFKIPLFILGGVLLLVLIIIIFANIDGSKNEYFLILKGDENITIYKGDSYNEPGYIGTDSKHNDLTANVVVDNQVNDDVIGEYKITYKLNNITKTRYVNVIEKPIGATSIYLKKGPDGMIDVFLKVGEKYVEPGYEVIDTVDSNLTNKVKVNNPVDTSKSGTYKIIYSVVNSSGVTTSEFRMVYVR